MISRISALVVLLSVGLGSTAYAQMEESKERVAVTAAFSADVVGPGDNFSLIVELAIEDGWHINANQPTLNFLIGTSLQLRQSDAFFLLGMEYPDAKEYLFEFVDEPIAVYTGTSEIVARLRASPRLQPGEHEVEGILVVQACDDSVCLAPSNIPVRATFRSAAGR
jgi:thioredoxin:protein disulfide reductase